MATKKTYTIREAAKKLGITPESVLKAIQKGRLKAQKKVVKVPQEIRMIEDLSVEAYVVSKSHQSRGSKRH
ncbi:MAG: helix-turn-helix domain-containing protein [Nitrospiria bacterium]